MELQLCGFSPGFHIHNFCFCEQSQTLSLYTAPIILHLMPYNESICSVSRRLSRNKNLAVQTSLSIPPPVLRRAAAGENKREVTSRVNPSLLGHMISAAGTPSCRLSGCEPTAQCIAFPLAVIFSLVQNVLEETVCGLIEFSFE